MLCDVLLAKPVENHASSEIWYILRFFRRLSYYSELHVILVVYDQPIQESWCLNASKKKKKKKSVLNAMKKEYIQQFYRPFLYRNTFIQINTFIFICEGAISTELILIIEKRFKFFQGQIEMFSFTKWSTFNNVTW